MELTRYQKLGRKAIDARLRENPEKEYISLFTASSVADEAARKAGKVWDLFTDLWSYARILPPGARTTWIRLGGSDPQRTYTGGMLVVLNPYYRGPATTVSYNADMDFGPGFPQ